MYVPSFKIGLLEKNIMAIAPNETHTPKVNPLTHDKYFV